MNYLSKKKELKSIILNDPYDYDTLNYRLLNSNCLDSIIPKIESIGNIYNDNGKIKMSANKQFVHNLNRFVYFFKKYFPQMNNLTESMIIYLINTNLEQMEKYLLSQYAPNDNTHRKTVYKIYINNFIKNNKYIPTIKNLLKKENIKIKPIDDYSLDEILKIRTLISDLIMCSDDNFSAIVLFFDIEYEINKFLKIKNNKVTNIDMPVLEHFKMNYMSIISDYTSKKEYLKYFKGKQVSQN